jgi:hypothetical protein
MKIKHALIAPIIVLALAACEVPEDGGTAADRSSVNQKKAGKDGVKAAKASAPKESPAQENARESAEKYLDVSAFSRIGLIKQLKFEGYSDKDAAYGVDAQKADWNKQAAAKAQEYLDASSFSRSGLIGQLKFEGFTPAQAEYGVNKVGL